MTEGMGQVHGSGYWCANPKCRKKLDGWTATDKGGASPQPGDLSVCAYCGCVLEFVDNGVVNVTPEKWKALPEQTQREIKRAAAAIQAVFGQRLKP